MALCGTFLEIVSFTFAASWTELHKFCVSSTSDLRSLSDDEDRLLQLVMELPQLSKIAGDRQHICEKNEQLASMCSRAHVLFECNGDQFLMLETLPGHVPR